MDPEYISDMNGKVSFFLLLTRHNLSDGQNRTISNTGYFIKLVAKLGRTCVGYPLKTHNTMIQWMQTYKENPGCRTTVGPRLLQGWQ